MDEVALELVSLLEVSIVNVLSVDEPVGFRAFAVSIQFTNLARRWVPGSFFFLFL